MSYQITALDSKNRFLGLTADAQKWFKAEGISEFVKNTYSATSTSVNPGSTTTIKLQPVLDQPIQIEKMFITFEVVNSHATVTATSFNPVNWIEELEISVNNVKIARKYNRFDLKTMLAWESLIPNVLEEGDVKMGEDMLFEMREELDTYSGITVPALGRKKFRIPVYLLFPCLMDLMTNSAPRISELRFDIAFVPNRGSALENAKFVAASTNTNIMANITFEKIQIETWECKVSDRLLTRHFNTLYHFPEYWVEEKSVDWSTNGNSIKIKLSEIGRQKVTGLSLILLDNPTAYNDADSQKMYGGPEVFSVIYSKIGSHAAKIDFTTDEHENKMFAKWNLNQLFGGTNPKIMPADFLNGGSDFTNYFCPSTYHIDLRKIDTENGHRVLTHVNTNLNDYEFEVFCNAADGTFSSDCRLYFVMHSDRFYNVQDSGDVREITY